MSASSSIAAAKRRRGGGNPPPPASAQRPQSAGNVLTPQQRALLLQQQQQMAQKSSMPAPSPNASTTYNPNFIPNSSPASSSDSQSNNLQIVSGPNGMSIPVGPDGKPLHPGVLIMNHEKRISDLERSVSSNGGLMKNLDSNGVNIIIEEGESAPWDEDIGVLNLKTEELHRRVTLLEKSRVVQPAVSNVVSTPTQITSIGNDSLQEKVNLLERQLETAKALLLKVQSFAMETNTLLLKYINNNDKKQLNDTTENTLSHNNENEKRLSEWLEQSQSIQIQEDKLEDLEALELQPSLEVDNSLESDNQDSDDKQPTFANDLN